MFGLIIDASIVSDTGTLTRILDKWLSTKGLSISTADAARVAFVGVHKVARLRCASEIKLL